MVIVHFYRFFEVECIKTLVQERWHGLIVGLLGPSLTRLEVYAALLQVYKCTEIS